MDKVQRRAAHIVKMIIDVYNLAYQSPSDVHCHRCSVFSVEIVIECSFGERENPY